MLQALEDRTKKQDQALSIQRATTICSGSARSSRRSLIGRLLMSLIEDKLADLGFDSLMFVELQAAVEDAGGRVFRRIHLNEVQSVRELLTAVQRVDRSKRLADEPRVEEKEGRRKRSSFPVRSPRWATRLSISLRTLSTKASSNTEIDGQANVPFSTNFIVAPNHTSHLDTGLVKKALGKDAAEQTVAVAAADYWFDTKYKRAYMNNFTTLVPIERTGSLRQSLRHVTQILNEGYNALIFPEGGRQESGQIAEFKPIIGYLALNQKIGILPIYIWGTYQAFPKGTIIPKTTSIGAKIGAKVGRFLEYDELRK